MVRSTRTNCGLIVRAQRACSSPAFASSALTSTALTRFRLCDRCADRELGTFELDVSYTRDPAQQRNRRRVAARGERSDLGDACRARVCNELPREGGPDAAVLVLVSDREGNLRGRAVAH